MPPPPLGLMAVGSPLLGESGTDWRCPGWCKPPKDVPAWLRPDSASFPVREMMKMPRRLRSAIFCHLVELLRTEDPTWQMVAMVFFIEVSLMAPLQAPPDARFSHAHHCGESWGSGWALVGTMEEQMSKQCAVVWGTGTLCNPCCLSLSGLGLALRPCPELMVGASTTPQQLPLPVFQMLDFTNISEELVRALEIFPIYLQSQCLGMPSLVLRAILRLTERPDTVSRGQPGQQPRVEQWVTWQLRLSWALWAVLAAASSPASPALCPMAVPCQGEKQQC